MAVLFAKQIALIDLSIALFKKLVADNKDKTEALNALNDTIKSNETDIKNITFRLDQRLFN